MNNIENLDAEELLHLSLKAMESGNHDSAIIYLKRSIELSPNNAQAHYLLSAEYAEIGMYERAAEGMTKALELNPSMGTARFQLGLLHITSGNKDQAAMVWEQLSELGETHPLYLFKEGLLKLSEDQFEESLKLLKEGISQNNINPALNNDMERIVANINDILSNGSANHQAENENDKEENQPSGNHIFLNNYRDS